MKKNRLVILFLCFSMLIFSQQKGVKQLEREAREDIREGNKLYNQLKFEEAEILYKKALTKNPNYPKASYNLGNTIYQQDRNKEAVNQFELVEKTFNKKMNKAEAYHNMGNSFMKEKQYDKAVEAYKNSMRKNSKDDETRYNLAMAQELLKKQQQDNKGDKNKDQKDKEGGDEENKNEKDKEKDKEDNKADENRNKKDKQDQNKKKDQKPRQNKLSPEQMKQLLEAMNNEENKTLKKLNAQKAKSKKIKQEKDW